MIFFTQRYEKLVGWVDSALRKAHEKFKSSKNDFSGILYNFDSAGRAPKLTRWPYFYITPVFLHGHTSRQHKNDLKVRDFKVLQVCVDVIQCAAKILLIK